jgi:hypothetical protein
MGSGGLEEGADDGTSFLTRLVLPQHPINETKIRVACPSRGKGGRRIYWKERKVMDMDYYNKLMAKE